MRLMILGAAMLLLGSPAIGETKPNKPSAATAAKEKDTSAKEKADDFDIGQLMAVFDKVFPDQVEPLSTAFCLTVPMGG
jgi:hypothetical protein